MPKKQTITAAQAKKASDVMTREMLKRPRVAAFQELAGGITLAATKTALKPCMADIEREIAELRVMLPDVADSSAATNAVQAVIDTLTYSYSLTEIARRWPSGCTELIARARVLDTRLWLDGEPTFEPFTPSGYWRHIVDQKEGR